MSNSIMPLDEAREWVAQDKSTRNTARAARTIVAQAEQIETLSRLLSGAEEAAIERAEQIERLQKAVAEAEVIFWEATGQDMEQQLERRSVTLKHGDMEDPA